MMMIENKQCSMCMNCSELLVDTSARNRLQMINIKQLVLKKRLNELYDKK